MTAFSRTNGLDSNVLRNSCLMEQQALDRIETLKTPDRELAIAKLLGIEKVFSGSSNIQGGEKG